jgi:hypothetical protein
MVRREPAGCQGSPTRTKVWENRLNESNENQGTTSRFPCHCCHKKDAIYWSDKRQCFICENCLKTFDRAIIARRNDITVEQLTLC